MAGKAGIIQDKTGSNSSTRVIGISIVANAVLMLWACIIFGFLHPENFVAAISTGAGMFTAMTTGTFVYLYNNKKQELEKLPNTEDTDPEK